MFFYQTGNCPHQIAIVLATTSPTAFLDHVKICEVVLPASSCVPVVLSIIAKKWRIFQVCDAPLVCQLNHSICFTCWYWNNGAPLACSIGKVDDI